MAWLIYDLRLDQATNRYVLELSRIAYTQLESSLERITRPQAGDEAEFLADLQDRLDKKLENGNPPDAPILQLE